MWIGERGDVMSDNKTQSRSQGGSTLRPEEEILAWPVGRLRP